MSKHHDRPPLIQQMEDERPYDEPIGKKRYERELLELQIELLKMQQSVQDTGARVVIVFEGRDAAGKGGAIRRFTDHLNPRQARTAALTVPNDTERGQWYFQRYVRHLPTTGEIVLFDRSWYNRAGVERVMGFCTSEQYQIFFEQLPGFERSLVQSGIHLFKLWFTVSAEEQQRRFEARKDDPLKQWKLSPMDQEAIRRYDEYTRARDAMLIGTNHLDGPWTVINSNEQKRARLESMRHVLHCLDYGSKDDKVAHAPDAKIVRPASEVM